VSDEIKKPKEPILPPSVRDAPENKNPITSIQEFGKRTANLYLTGKGNENLADPFAAISAMAPCSGDFKDLSGVRPAFPDWEPSNCDECGKCYTACPDTALLGLINTVEEVCATNIGILEKAGHDVKLLKKHLAPLAESFREFAKNRAKETKIAMIFRKAVDQTVGKSDVSEEEKADLKKQGALFLETMGDFKFSLTAKGGLFSLTVDPYKCKGCMLCAEVCEKENLAAVTPTDEGTAHLKKDWEYWRKLPTTNPAFSRISDLNEGAGALETILLDKKNQASMVCGDGACVGCGQKTPLRLFTATITALMQERVKKHVNHLDELISELEKKINNFVGTVSLRNEATLQETVDKMSPEEYAWYERAIDTLAKLKDLVFKYTEGTSGNGRANMLFVNATGCSSVYGATWPFNPYPFPWANNLFQDASSVAMGVFEGHMAKMADGFKAVRTAELILEEESDEKKYDFTYFDWEKFTEEEYRLCPPVVAVGGDGAMYDIGFQNVSRTLMTGKPVKILVLDTQYYSNTGGQACTSSFVGQISDMSPYGARYDGKHEEMRKEMALVAMAHRTAYVFSGGIADTNHLISGYIEGLNYRGPALFNIYCPCPPEHIIADDQSVAHSKMSRDSRAYPLIKFYPNRGKAWSECLSLEGNPAMEADWPIYELKYKNAYGETETMPLPYTFADFAVQEGRFAKHFKKEKADTWTEELVPLADYIEMSADEQIGLVPYMLAAGADGKLIRILPSPTMVRSTVERRDYWRLLKSMARVGEADASPSIEELTAIIRKEEAAKLLAKLAGLIGEGNLDLDSLPVVPKNEEEISVPKSEEKSDGWKPVTVDTEDCTSCEKCFGVNKKIFGKRGDGKAVILDPKAGKFADIVKAAEQCATGLIHAGTPHDPKEKNLEKLIARAKNFQ
jgi:pyruvate-ferredoxin/flavodoxin oxidoreductase